MPIQFVGSRRWEVENAKLHFHAYCWKLRITQTEQTYHWTEYPMPLLLFDGQLYASAASSTAREDVSGLESGTKEVSGFVQPSHILGLSADDILRGAMRGATLEEYLVDVREPWLSPIDFKQYWVTETTYDGTRWEASLEGIAYPLQEQIGEYWGPQCRAELFSSGNGKCNANILEFSGSAPISLINTQGTDFEISSVVAPWTSNGYANGGKIYFNAGNNVGGYYTIKEYIYPGTGGAGTARIRLQRRTLRDFTVGDRITTYPGCNHSPSDCQNKFDNFINYQGEPFIPGGDAATRGRKSK